MDVVFIYHYFDISGSCTYYLPYTDWSVSLLAEIHHSHTLWERRCFGSFLSGLPPAVLWCPSDDPCVWWPPIWRRWAWPCVPLWRWICSCFHHQRRSIHNTPRFPLEMSNTELVYYNTTDKIIVYLVLSYIAMLFHKLPHSLLMLFFIKLIIKKHLYSYKGKK